MNDMSAVIIPKSDQINADDLLTGPITITIEKVEIKPGTEQPVSIRFTNDNGKPYRPCKSMARVMVYCWGPDANKYVGHSMTLYCDPKVMWGGMAVGGIRISHMTGINGTQTLALTATKGNKKPFVVKPLATPGPAVKAASAPPEPPPSDDMVEKYPTLFNIPDGRTWLGNLKAALEAAMTPEDVIEIGGLSSVSTTLQKAPPAVQAQIKAMLSGAKERVSAPAWNDAPEFSDEATDDTTLLTRVESLVAEMSKLNRDTFPAFSKRKDYKDIFGELSGDQHNAMLVKIRDAAQAANVREG